MKTNTSIDGHTPGPWIVNPLSAWVEIPGEDAPICAMLWPTELRSEDETFANARLIAAAPELLAELRALVAAVRFADPPKAFNGVECHEARVPVAFIEGAERAIAKAVQP